MRINHFILLGLSAALVGCAKNPHSDIDPVCRTRTPIDNKAKADILIIGDSISIGYTPTVQAELREYEVLHNPCNAKSTRNGLKHIDRWMSLRDRYELITFNHGIWDISFGVSAEQYAENLRILVGVMRHKTDKLIFVTTTHLPSGSSLTIQEPGVEDRYNQAAIAVMNELGVPVFDLNSISDAIPELHSEGADGADVHWNDKGSRIFGEALTEAIRGELAQ